MGGLEETFLGKKKRKPVMPPLFKAGDFVRALVDGGRDPDGLPEDIPKKGKVYEIASIYAMEYGLGCTLVGLMHGPYNGYVLGMYNNARGKIVWAFEKVEADDIDEEEEYDD